MIQKEFLLEYFRWKTHVSFEFVIHLKSNVQKQDYLDIFTHILQKNERVKLFCICNELFFNFSFLWKTLF